MPAPDCDSSDSDLVFYSKFHDQKLRCNPRKAISKSCHNSSAKNSTNIPVTNQQYPCKCFSFLSFFLHLHEIMMVLCFNCCLSVRMAVCLSVNKIPAERMHQFGRNFRYTVVYSTGTDPVEICDLGSKVKVTVNQYSFFLHSSLLTPLLSISALLCLIKMKFDMSLRYALGRCV